MEYPLGHTLRFRDRAEGLVPEGYAGHVIREGTVNGDSIEAKEGVFYPVWTDRGKGGETIYVHFDNVIEDDD